MNVTMACIAGEEIHRQWDAGRFTGKALGSRTTPFGPSGETFLVDSDQPFYLLPRYGAGMAKTPIHRVNHRANLYALKDLGVVQVLSWAPGGAVTHDFSIGEAVVLDDLIDQTYLRAKTFFEDSPLGYLREFPVFCPSLRRVSCEVLDAMKLHHHCTGIAAVREGPRMETPAEVRMLGSLGAQVVTHHFVPEVFLAKELELCYGAICYPVNYAETGSRHRPFASGELFNNLSQRSDRERLNLTLANMEPFLRQLATAVASMKKECECDQTMARNKGAYGLSEDWHEWFKN